MNMHKWKQVKFMIVISLINTMASEYAPSISLEKLWFIKFRYGSAITSDAIVSRAEFVVHVILEAICTLRISVIFGCE